MIGHCISHRPQLTGLYCVIFIDLYLCISLLRGINMAGVKSFYDITTKTLTGEEFKFSSLQGKVVLIENVASLWGTTTRDYTQMNELHERFSDKGLVILGVPCNQFGYQVRWHQHLSDSFNSPLLPNRCLWRTSSVMPCCLIHLFYIWWFICTCKGQPTLKNKKWNKYINKRQW